MNNANPTPCEIQVTIEVAGDQISVRGPYSTANNEVWRSIGGRFEDGQWLLPNTPNSRTTIADLFGALSDPVKVLVPASLLRNAEIVQIGGYVLASRRERDWPVRLAPGVMLFQGSFDRSGGSRKNPCVDLHSDMIFLLCCRKEFADRHGLLPPPTEGADIVAV